MRTVVAIHNTVNERTWREILRWEADYPECLAELKLLRFGGRPDEPTWKAQIYTFFGYKPPFDRHDWVVERCGKEVKYLIDYYQGRPSPGTHGSLTREVSSRRLQVTSQALCRQPRQQASCAHMTVHRAKRPGGAVAGKPVAMHIDARPSGDDLSGECGSVPYAVRLAM